MKRISHSANGGNKSGPPKGSTDAKAKSFLPKAGHKSPKSSHKGTMSKAKTFC